MKSIESINHNSLEYVRSIVKRIGCNKDQLLKRLGLTLLGDKSLEQYEFLECMASLDDQLSELQLKDVFTKIQKNGSVKITKLVENLLERSNADLLKDVTKRIFESIKTQRDKMDRLLSDLDKNHTGQVMASQLVLILKELCAFSIMKRDIEVFVDSLEQRNGMVDYVKFKRELDKSANFESPLVSLLEKIESFMH